MGQLQAVQLGGLRNYYLTPVVLRNRREDREELQEDGQELLPRYPHRHPSQYARPDTEAASQPKAEKQAIDALDPEEGITYFDKLDFSTKVESLDEQELEKLIEWIQANCPEALREVSE